VCADELAQHQLSRLNELLSAILPANRFYAEKLAGIEVPLESMDQIATFPFTFKEELTGRRSADLAVNATYSLESYVRFHRTSGTHGRPMVVLDTAEDWQWWVSTWQYVLDVADITPADRVVMAFSFGPFIGFWSAHDAFVSRGAMVIPAGGLSTIARLDLMESSRATVVCCTPSYALHMAEVAAESQRHVARNHVTRLIVAGEPGGSVPATRERIETAWGARVIDHGGATEVGPWGYADIPRLGLHVIESEFVAEFRSVETGQDAAAGELSELVLTTLGRYGCPIIRYRT
jgi:phenylacetate-CoA ligase